MKVWGMTDTGLVRDENQDAYAVETIGPYMAAVVCDGMGGASGGRVASTIAVETVMRQLHLSLEDARGDQTLSQILLYGLSRANMAIRQRAEEEPECRKMGTTLVCAVCTPAQALVANIGDSRAYLLSDEGIRQISRDHSVVENMVENGEITAAQARCHPNRNLITRALGPDEHIRPDCFTVDWHKDDYILLCTDGLVNTVSDQEILFEVLHEGQPDESLTRLLAVSKQRGAPDNVTAVLLMNA